MSSQSQDVEREIGSQLFDRLPRGVRLNAAGRALLEDTRLILQQVNEATIRAGRVARGLAGTLRVGFTESASCHGVVPASFCRFRRRQPNAELQLSPLSSRDQAEAGRAARVDTGYI